MFTDRADAGQRLAEALRHLEGVNPGRPDLAGPWLADVRAPTLLIVGGHDTTVLDLNEHAQRELRCENRLAIVPGTTHLCEEPGALDEVETGPFTDRHFTTRLGFGRSGWSGKVRTAYHQQTKNMLVSYSPKKLGFF